METFYADFSVDADSRLRVMQVMEEVGAPINFDIIDHFSFNNAQHKEQLKKNQVIMVGNVGEEGARYIENTKLYKMLDLFVNGRLA